MNAALYIRVSTDDQLELSPDSQKKLLLEYAKTNTLIVEKEHIFIDEGISGRKAEKRPEFMRMISLAKQKNKEFQKILVWKFSRFARNQEESIVYKNMLRKDGIEVISISEPVIDGPFGDLIERIIEWMDEYYSIRLSGEVTRGMKEKALRGGVQSSPVLGYDIIDNQYVINEDEARIVRKAYDMVLNDDTCGVIAKHFNSLGMKNKRGNLFTGRVIRYMIQNPVYYGMIRWNYANQKTGSRKINPEEDWILSKGTHIPIVDKEIWIKANEKITYTPSTKKPSTEYRHWLGGILRCKHCGGTLVFGTNKSIKGNNVYLHHRFSCNNYIKAKCTHSNSISVKKIEKEVIHMLEEVSQLFLNNQYDIQQIAVRNNNNHEKTLINQQIEKLDKMLKKAKKAYLAEIDTLDEYRHNKTTIQAEKDALLKKLNSIDYKEDLSPIMFNNCNNAIDAIKNNYSIMEINKCLKLFIDSIVLSKEDDTLELKLFHNSYSI